MTKFTDFKMDGSEDKDWLYNNFNRAVVYFDPFEFDSTDNQYEMATGKGDCKGTGDCCDNCRKNKNKNKYNTMTGLKSFSNADGGGTSYYDPQLAKDTLGLINNLFGKGKDLPSQSSAQTPPYIPTPPASPAKTGMSTGAIIGWSVAGLAVATGLFFGIRALVRK